MTAKNQGDRSLWVVAFFLSGVASLLPSLRLRDRFDPRRSALLAVGGFLALALKARKLPGVETAIELDKTDSLDGDADHSAVAGGSVDGHGTPRSGDSAGNGGTTSTTTKKPRVHSTSYGGSTSIDDVSQWDVAPAPWEDGGSLMDRIPMPVFGQEETLVLEALVAEDAPWA